VETNVIVIRVTNAMLPPLRHSAHPRIVNQSSHVGSLATCPFGALWAAGVDTAPCTTR
jgi:hypothetical protein